MNCLYCGSPNPPSRGPRERKYCSKKCAGRQYTKEGRYSKRSPGWGDKAREERNQKSNLYNNGELTIVSRTHGSHVVLYDMEDETKLKEHTWSLTTTSRRAGVYYVITMIPHPNGEWYVRKDGTRKRKRKTLLIHHLIKEVPKGMCIDHRNGNPLDNRKENLLVTTQKRNDQNRRKYITNTSGFKGVCRTRDSKRLGERWQARFCIDGKYCSLGTFSTAEEAAKAYDMAVCKYWEVVSPERQLNFPERYDEYMADVKKLQEKNLRLLS